jgi:hypothetical protein
MELNENEGKEDHGSHDHDHESYNNSNDLIDKSDPSYKKMNFHERNKSMPDFVQ